MSADFFAQVIMDPTNKTSQNRKSINGSQATPATRVSQVSQVSQALQTSPAASASADNLRNMVKKLQCDVKKIRT